ncbi:MAG: hypothetical protein PUD64_07995, partial [Bacteroidales bacterium]|nr:hypothetical protein [Bacteroidales bacterium]
MQKSPNLFHENMQKSPNLFHGIMQNLISPKFFEVISLVSPKFEGWSGREPWSFNMLYSPLFFYHKTYCYLRKK